MAVSAAAARAAVPFKTVGVIGLGLMGHGIAQVTAAAGFKVVSVDADAGAVQKGLDAIRKSLTAMTAKAVKAGSLPAAEAEGRVASVLSSISAGTDRGALAGCDLVIEAAPERLELKRSLYGDLSRILPSNTIVASNTSGLEIGELARFYGRPEVCCGLHYFNPVQIMQLVEVIGTPQLPASTLTHLTAFVRACGKTPVVAADSPGFVVNRLLVPYIAQAVAMADRGVASVSDIDVAMKLGTGVPMGPLQLADYVGLDTTLFILQNWTAKYPTEPAFFVPAGLKARVDAGHLGRKSGRGFYHWNGNAVGEVAPAP